MSGLKIKIIHFLVGHRGPHEDSSRVGCGPRAGRCAPLIYNLVICFLKDRSHVRRFSGQTSVIAYINASVVQGSGPSSFDIVASDLHPLHASNSIVKYADDTYLIIPASARLHVTCTSELEHISSWATKNNLRLNADRSK